MKATLTHIEDSTVSILIENLSLETSKEIAKSLRVDSNVEITAATLNRIIKTGKSSAGFNLEVDGVLYPWSDRDIKTFGITEAIQPSFENMTQIVTEEVEAPIAEAQAQVVESIVEDLDTSADPDDINLSSENVNWLKRNPNAPKELQKVRKNSKLWEIVVMLKKQRLTLKELQDALYDVGLDVDQITDYKISQAMYDLCWKGYNIAKVKCEDGETRFAIRTLDLLKVGTILVY